MFKKEKVKDPKTEKLEGNENPKLESIEDDELDEVTGGRGLNPPRVDVHNYTDDVKNRM